MLKEKIVSLTLSAKFTGGKEHLVFVLKLHDNGCSSFFLEVLFPLLHP